jgi:hypothetical protein
MRGDERDERNVRLALDRRRLDVREPIPSGCRTSRASGAFGFTLTRSIAAGAAATGVT